MKGRWTMGDVIYTEDWKYWLWIALVSFLAAINILVIKQYATTKKIMWLVIVIVTTVALTFSYVKLFEHANVGITYAIAKALSVIIVVIASILIFNENISVTAWIGILLIVIGIILI